MQSFMGVRYSIFGYAEVYGCPLFSLHILHGCPIVSFQLLFLEIMGLRWSDPGRPLSAGGIQGWQRQTESVPHTPGELLGYSAGGEKGWIQCDWTP